MPESYAQSAVRHFHDAERLATHGRFDDAGYLIGYAVECAVKDAIESARPGVGAPHIHLPDLVERAKKHLHGRRRQSVFTVLSKVGFMNGWIVNLRYEADATITQAIYDRWKQDATRMLGAAGLRPKAN